MVKCAVFNEISRALWYTLYKLTQNEAIPKYFVHGWPKTYFSVGKEIPFVGFVEWYQIKRNAILVLFCGIIFAPNLKKYV